MSTKFKKFEGMDVIQSSVKITGTGDGLSKDMVLEQIELAQGDTVFVLLELEVTEIGHKKVKDTEALCRRHTCKAQMGVIVDEEFARERIAAQRELVQRRRDAAAGQGRLDDEDPDRKD